ncbi:MAG: hypothetical protein U0W40_19285 [Acidimicrobiia bacterium]
MATSGPTITVDELADWPERCFALGLTDGLPAFPPLADAVAALVEASGRAGDEELGEIAPRMGVATVEALAANAVMRRLPPWTTSRWCWRRSS